MAVLNANNVTKVYGGKDEANCTYALNGVSISINEGEFVGIMGPSGSGKTTLVNILSGISTPTTGSVHICEKNIVELDKYQMALFRRQKLGFVFQEFNLLDSLTLKENIMLPMILDKRKAVDMKKKVEEIMTLFGISDIGDKYPYNVSGGQQQRAAVSRSLMNNPAIVFADEPTGNLDSKASKAVMNCFEKINKESNSTILMVTHDVFAASFCRRIIFIKDGTVNMEIVSKGDRTEFFQRILDCLAIIGGERSDI